MQATARLLAQVDECQIPNHEIVSSSPGPSTFDFCSLFAANPLQL